MTTAKPTPRPAVGAVPKARLPLNLIEIRRLFDALDWQAMATSVEAEAQSRVAIVGPVNSGKSTLFNTLKGEDVSPVGAVPGTTRELQFEQWGPFTLTDTPGFGEVDGVDRANVALQGVRNASVIILVLDAVAGVRQADHALLQQLRATGKPVVVVLNKIDVLKKNVDDVVADARHKLGEPYLIPISAQKGTNVARSLLPRLIDVQPALAVALGRALPGYRRRAANRIIRNAAIVNGLIGAEPIPGLDIPFLIAIQARMVLRLAAIFGEPMTFGRANTLAASIVGGMVLRYLAMEGAKFIPGPGWIVSAVISGTGTWAIGQVALRYFENSKKMSTSEMQGLYKRLVRRKREDLIPGGEEGEALNNEV
jgi:small GTP-binding protein